MKTKIKVAVSRFAYYHENGLTALLVGLTAGSAVWAILPVAILAGLMGGCK